MGRLATGMQDGAERAVAGRIASSGRLRLRHGPIDVIIDLSGDPHTVVRAEAALRRGFAGLLGGLVTELSLLRAPVDTGSAAPTGPVARRMMAAARPHAAVFVTPMAAVAGAVADHLLSVALSAAPLRRALVNDGGDIALWLAPGEVTRLAVAAPGGQPARITLRGGDGIGGVATSGWRGRSHSLGIADAVTVLARDAATADAAATMIANEVQLEDSAAVTRVPACELAPDSDLGPQLVTTDVGRLSDDEVAAALDRGTAEARRLVAAGVVAAVFLGLRGEARIEGMAGYAALQAQTHPRSKHMLEFADA